MSRCVSTKALTHFVDWRAVDVGRDASDVVLAVEQQWIREILHKGKNMRQILHGGRAALCSF